MTEHQNDERTPEPEEQEPTPRGSMRYQDPESTTPREPSVAEQRARRKAEEREQARAQAEAQAAQEQLEKAERRRKLMLGGGVTVGIAALIGAWYITSTPDEVTATCTDKNGNVAKDERVCDQQYVEQHGGHPGAGGMMFLPIFMGGGQYHYNYGGTVQNGRVTGGSFTKPDGANIKTKSGKTVQRGGLGTGKGGFGKGGFGGKSGGS
ncbi:hypothetical protein [Sciscionella marina]|uniref:hypothetical protein n=1 Tax=Sciscionella marina TaxID=508770 RepID=UPI00036E2233